MRTAAMVLRTGVRMMCAVGLTVATFPAAAASADTDGAVSIDRLVDDVVANNAERQFYERELAAARIGRTAAGRLADPELIVEFGEKTTSGVLPSGGGNGGGTLGPGQAYQVSIVQPLEFNGRIALRRAIADRQIDIAVLGYQQYTATLAARARTLAYTLFTASAKVDAANAVATRIEGVAAVTVQRDIAGPSPLIAARILEAGALIARRQAETAIADYNSALYELNQLRGTPFASRIRLITPPLDLPALPPPAVLVEQAQTRNFEIRSLQAELDQQGLKVSLARRSRAGLVSVGPYYRQETAGTTDRFAGIHVTMPLPVWNRQATDVAIEQGRVAQAESSLFAQVRTVERSLFDQAAIYRARSASLTRLPANSAARFREMADLAERSYRLGAVTATVYLDAQRQYLDAETAILDTRREALAARLQVDVLTGNTTGDAR
ncbi:TolC family protein [Glacieibacterium megasporae]|uniref:TolC family protein n=1 Tax=Glacieibacterium megasporae TaxID=2835787 RepID=UPI0021023CCE|nr:TolC family protein [Polymorphobacter megasporae]